MENWTYFFVKLKMDVTILYIKWVYKAKKQRDFFTWHNHLKTFQYKWNPFGSVTNKNN